jgi:hypothetical protein
VKTVVEKPPEFRQRLVGVVGDVLRFGPRNGLASFHDHERVGQAVPDVSDGTFLLAFKESGFPDEHLKVGRIPLLWIAPHR